MNLHFFSSRTIFLISSSNGFGVVKSGSPGPKDIIFFLSWIESIFSTNVLGICFSLFDIEGIQITSYNLFC